MQTTGQKISTFLTVLFTAVLAPTADATLSSTPYSDSAHGSTTYGVDRDALTGTYNQGNCAHCHEQHASIGGSEPAPNSPSGPSEFLLLADPLPSSPATQNPYAATESACLACHGGTENNSNPVNNNYSATFGGATAEATTILAAFNLNSYHNLNDIDTFLETASGFDVPADATPCGGCHNPHLAKANKQDIGDPTDTALSRPTDHFDLYGDDTSERMPDSTTSPGEYYQPPNRVGGGLEPDGGTIAATQAAKTPDYNSFCIDCHNNTNLIWSAALGRNLRTFNWSLEQHGGGNAANGRPTQAEVLSPFSDTNLGSYTLSCLDCHEPHGSSNIYLIRSSVNAGSVSLTNSANEWDNLCKRCHTASDSNAIQSIHHEFQSVLDCIDCHFCTSNGGRCISDSDPKIRDCSVCHYHGASKDAYKTF